MRATSDGPKVEDFGITEDDLVRAPRLFIANHRPEILILMYFGIAVALFVIILQIVHSWTAAAFFTIVVLAAWSVLVLPLMVLVLCGGEHLEERWLCRQVPALRSCLAYTRAAAAYREKTRKIPVLQPSTAEEWAVCTPASFRVGVKSLLERPAGDPVVECDREATGIDFRVDSADQRAILRCETGTTPVPASVARELMGALVDFESDVAVIVTASDLDPACEAYIADRPICPVPPWDLARLSGRWCSYDDD